MQGESRSRSGVLQWVVVLVVGVFVVTVVLGLNLIPRLNDGQKVLDSARPAFASDRLTGARAGIDIISADVDTADPIMNPQGGAAAEVPKLIAFVSQKTGLSQAQVVAALQKNFPHTTALLQTIPLSSVTAELPGLLAFLEKTLNVSQAQLIAALKANFPALAQSITNLPTVTERLGRHPGHRRAHALRRHARQDRAAAADVLQLGPDPRPRDPAEQLRQPRRDLVRQLDRAAPADRRAGRDRVRGADDLAEPQGAGLARACRSRARAVVVVVGVGVVALVLVLSLIPRVSDGQKLLDALRPANTAARVQGDRAGISMVSAIVDTEDPIMTPQGGAAAEVPKLIAFVSQKTGLSQAQVVAALQKNFPHTTALLQTIPLSSVTTELPGLLAFLEKTLHVSQAQLIAALKTNFPALAQAITNLPTVTSGWNQVQNIDGATSFDGKPVKTVPDVRTYFSSDVIPVLETQRGNYDEPRLDLEDRLHRLAGADRRDHRDHLRGAHADPGPAARAGHERGHEALARGGGGMSALLIASSTAWQVGIALGIVVIAVAAVIVIVIVRARDQDRQAGEDGRAGGRGGAPADRRARRHRADQRLGRADPARRPVAAKGGGREMTLRSPHSRPTPTGRSP